MSIVRTEEGQINRYLFYPNIVVWVEGTDDIPFCSNGLVDDSCVLLPAGGKEECHKLANALISEKLPYVVVLDGDFDILKRKRSVHRRVVRLGRYAVENYLFEKDLINRICQDYIRIKGAGRTELVEKVEELGVKICGSFDELLTTIESKLAQLVVLAVAHSEKNTGYKVVPSRIDSVLRGSRGLVFLDSEIERRCGESKMGLSIEEINSAEELVQNFTARKRFVDAIPGHLVFGILRRFLKREVKGATGRNITIDDEGIMILLATSVWRFAKGSDHRSIKRRLRRAVRDASRLRYAT